MPFYGLIDGEMQRPGIPDPRRAKCPECQTELIAKTGEIVTWHWAHAANAEDCAYAGESEWHLAWKARGIDGTQEVWRHDFTRRADIYSPAGFAVEFQRSRLTTAEVIARERDWKHRLVWIFDATTAYAAGNIEHDNDGPLTWWNPPDMILTAVRPLWHAGWGCRTFLDLGDDALWYAAWREPLYGRALNLRDQLFHGFEVTTESVVRNVLHARSATALAAMSLRMDLWRPNLAALEAGPG